MDLPNPMSGMLIGLAPVFLIAALVFYLVFRTRDSSLGAIYWSWNFLLNSLGFIIWAMNPAGSRGLVFFSGDFLHMAGFVMLSIGVNKFAGQAIGPRQRLVIGLTLLVYLVSVLLLGGLGYGHSLLGLMIARSALFFTAAHALLRPDRTGDRFGKRLTGYCLAAWGFTSLTTPFVLSSPFTTSLALGVGVAWHMAAALCMMVMLAGRFREEVKRLEGLLPICSCCKKIRNEHGGWEQVEDYMARHSGASFSHGLCDECMVSLYPEVADKVMALRKKPLRFPPA